MKAKITHAEIGTKVNCSNHWIHSFSNENFTVLTSHKNRGKKVIVKAGILLNFHGILTHDCWYAYDCFNVTYALCNAHLLRELNFLEKHTKLKFPTKIKNILFKLKDIIDLKEQLDEKSKLDFYLKYVFAVERLHFPFDNNVEGKRKKTKQSL